MAAKDEAAIVRGFLIIFVCILDFYIQDENGN